MRARQLTSGNYRLAINTLSGDAITIGNAATNIGLLLELTHQEQLLRFLLGRQDLFAVPTHPPFVVRVSLPYEMDNEQTTPAKNYTYHFDTLQKAELVRDAITGFLRTVNDDNVVCEILSLPEKDFYVSELKIYNGRAEEVPYGFLAEVLEEAEHRELLKTTYEKLTRDQWRSVLLNTLNIDAVEEAIDELTQIDSGVVMKDALIAARSQ